MFLCLLIAKTFSGCSIFKSLILHILTAQSWGKASRCLNLRGLNNVEIFIMTLCITVYQVLVYSIIC